MVLIIYVTLENNSCFVPLLNHSFSAEKTVTEVSGHCTVVNLCQFNDRYLSLIFFDFFNFLVELNLHYSSIKANLKTF